MNVIRSLPTSIALFLVTSSSAAAQSWDWKITTVAGTGNLSYSLPSTPVSAKNTSLGLLYSIAVADDGSIYFSAPSGVGVYEPRGQTVQLYMIRRPCDRGFVEGAHRLTFPGGGASYVTAIAVDGDENLYLAQRMAECGPGLTPLRSDIVKVEHSTGRVTRFSGGEYNVFHQAQYKSQPGLGHGNIGGLSVYMRLGRFPELWLIDNDPHPRAIGPHIGNIIFSGLHMYRYASDILAAPNANANGLPFMNTDVPRSLDIYVHPTSGNVYWAEIGSGKVRRWIKSQDRVYTIAQVSPSLGGDRIKSLVVDDNEQFVFVASTANVINSVWIGNGYTRRLAGQVGQPGFTQDPYGTAANALLNGPSDLAWHDGVLYFVESQNHVIRAIYSPSRGANICGDGVVTGREGCDDGNRITGDGCSADCFIEYIY